MKQKQKPLSFSLHPDNIAYIEAAVLKQKEANHRYSRSMYLDDLITHLRTKVKAKQKAVSELDLTDYPDNLNIAAWQKWVAFRKKVKFKAYKTNATMKKLAKMGSHDDQMQIVQNSIDDQYQGLFALKGNSNERFNGNNKSSGQKESSHERIKRENQLKYGQPDECGLAMGEDDRHLGREVGEGQRTEAISGLDIQPFIDYDQSS